MYLSCATLSLSHSVLSHPGLSDIWPYATGRTRDVSQARQWRLSIATDDAEFYMWKFSLTFLTDMIEVIIYFVFCSRIVRLLFSDERYQYRPPPPPLHRDFIGEFSLLLVYKVIIGLGNYSRRDQRRNKLMYGSIFFTDKNVFHSVYFQRKFIYISVHIY